MTDRPLTTAARPDARPSALIEALLEGAEFGLALFDSELRLTRVSAALARAQSSAECELIGATLAELWPDSADVLARAAQHALETGHSVTGLRILSQTSESDVEAAFDCGFYPVSEDCERVGIWALVREVPARQAASDAPDSERRRRALERELEDEHRIVTQLQVSLMPDRLPSIPATDLAAGFRPAGEGHEIGGDFFDVFPLGPECWMLVIGDVCGKGAEAASITALARYTLRAAAIQEGAEPAKLLAQLNEAVVRQRDDGRFLTAVCAFLEAGENGDGGLRLTLAVAGHPPPLRVSSGGQVEPVGGHGALIGVWETVPDLRDEVVELGPGDRLVLYTDGVVEAGAPAAELGEERLGALLGETAGQTAAATVAAIERAVLAQTDGTPRDDTAVLVVRPEPARDS